jgi:hypothetical protein
MEATVINHDEPIVIEEIPTSKQDEVPKEASRVEDKKDTEGDSKYCQPVWCPRGLNKTQWRKLQRAQHKQQKREQLAKMEGEILNPIHVEVPPEGQNAAAAAGQSAKPTLPAPTTLDELESAKPTPLLMLL